MTRHVQGAELRVGDVIAVWWQPKRDIITAIEPYTGALAHLFPRGAAILRFALCATGMTAGNDESFEVVALRGEVQS